MEAGTILENFIHSFIGVNEQFIQICLKKQKQQQQQQYKFKFGVALSTLLPSNPQQLIHTIITPILSFLIAHISSF